MKPTKYFVHTWKNGAVSVSGPHIPPRPDRYSTNAFASIEPYISRLLVSSRQSKSLFIFTPHRQRGFVFFAREGRVEVLLALQQSKGAARESAVRKLFSSLGIAPSRDYLADMTRVLHYPVHGNASGMTALTIRILQEVFGVSPEDALDITYEDKAPSA